MAKKRAKIDPIEIKREIKNSQIGIRTAAQIFLAIGVIIAASNYFIADFRGYLLVGGGVMVGIGLYLYLDVWLAYKKHLKDVGL